ncbi:sigma-54-dependent Fis family transcriptional regulator [Acidithiobacillus caldus]|jgi:sigma-54 specific flagellar transcriptional regulator A|uniref:Sigma-54 factor interaction domain-containing protein n=2 Tax=Acidithiobacillus caldus TaxID=33059 RepID=A0A1E7YNT1_9PROT|nr:sigma-54 dependent transcriptional regulator [Acidithiobacillus caldus]MBU2734336.1 sigma-54-dependent Fis family transcriptional regulator [Acidithiobacillus caldus ATCC 51756]MCE5419757.1 sigma-54-dependent Fis family transcriptional regulator [Acidithiobacillus sp.]AUW32770.1 sigma-54-dependent Fis family transcriptional regulator [Acidithiobacillus caldus]MBU2730263.1 sigma-54-dependent Fis family transcriptional regulator [Acidithiobacillus caldus]MBU2745819.1 sigma-54-dependent Fis fa
MDGPGNLSDSVVTQDGGHDRRSISRERCGLIGTSTAMREVTRVLGKVAQSDSTVLLLGESGTGKEVVAQCLHQHSSRRNGPFVAVNCGAIPAELMESELFGHEKGAFTGALVARKGRFELAEGGTLFLDEVAEMSPQMQVKLLRVLQERRFERVGGSRSLHANVRIIAATHRNLEDRIRENLFREDLYYRLNVFPVDLPPLRCRENDVRLLMEFFLKRQAAETGNLEVRLTEAAWRVLRDYHWPGNVRELQNLAERLSILHAGEEIDVEQLPERLRRHGAASQAEQEQQSLRAIWSEGFSPQPELPFDLKKHMEAVEKEFLLRALDECDQVVARAAERLGLRRTTMVEKLKKYALLPGRF